MHRLFAVLLIRQHSATACGAPRAPSSSGTALTQSPTWSPLGGDSAGAQQGHLQGYLRVICWRVRAEALDTSARRQRCGLSISTDISGVCAVRAQVSALGLLTHACPGRHSAAQQVSVHVLHKGQSEASVHHKQVTRREESSCSLNPSISKQTAGEVASTFRRGTVVALLSPFPPNSTDAGSTLKMSPGLPGWVKGRCLQQLQNTRLLLDLAYKPHFPFKLHAEKEKTAVSQTQHMCETEKHPGDACLNHIQASSMGLKNKTSSF